MKDLEIDSPFQDKLSDHCLKNTFILGLIKEMER